jgi:hypothetical protein
MSAQNRLFSSDAYWVAIYPNTDTFSPDGSTTALMDMISIFTDCHITATTSTANVRAVGEVGRFPLPVEINYEIQVGAVVEFEASPLYSTLMALFIDHGPGPYWVWIWPGPHSGAEYSWVGRAIITGVGHHLPLGAAQTQSLKLEIQGELMKGPT